MNQIKIVSDGTPQGTKVFASNTEIDGISGIGIDITAKGGVVAYLSFKNPILDIVADLKDGDRKK
jgi:hypothetical protein